MFTDYMQHFADMTETKIINYKLKQSQTLSRQILLTTVFSIPRMKNNQI